jgi:hypothetical protein
LATPNNEGSRNPSAERLKKTTLKEYQERNTSAVINLRQSLEKHKRTSIRSNMHHSTSMSKRANSKSPNKTERNFEL